MQMSSDETSHNKPCVTPIVREVPYSDNLPLLPLWPGSPLLPGGALALSGSWESWWKETLGYWMLEFEWKWKQMKNKWHTFDNPFTFAVS